MNRNNDPNMQQPDMRGKNTSGHTHLPTNFTGMPMNGVYTPYYFPMDPNDFVFIDFGSGKGRTLLLASEWRFKKIIGVEFARDLHEIAHKNCRTYRNSKQRCLEIESVHMDATEFPLPNGKSVYYFFNPFSPEIFSKVLENIRKSFIARPRKIYIFYYRSHEPAIRLIEAMGIMRKVETRPLRYDFTSPRQREFVVYESKDPRADPG